MANASYDTLTIKINADSRSANTSLNNLSKNLQKLNEVAKKVGTKKLENVKNVLIEIANIDFTNVAQSLDKVADALKNISKEVVSRTSKKGLKGAFPALDFTKVGSVEAILKPLENADLGTFEGFIQSLPTFVKSFEDASLSVGLTAEQLDQLGANAPTLTERLGEIGLTLEQIDNVLGRVKRVSKELDTSQLERVKQVLLEAGINAREADKAIYYLKKTTKTGFAKTLDIWGKQFTSLFRNRLFRAIIQLIRKAIEEGFQSVLGFDTLLQSSYNDFKDSFKYFVDSVGAILSPLFQMIAPTLSIVLDLVAKLANELAKLFATVNGQEGYAKAIKGQKYLANEIKKTQSTGIDELNVLNPNSQEGNFEWVETLKSGGIGLGKILADIVELLNPILDIIITILDLIKPLIDGLIAGLTAVSGVIDLIVGIITGDFDKVGKGWEKLWKGCANMFISFANVFIDMFKMVVSLVEQAINWIISGLDFIGKMFGGGFDYRVDFTSWIKHIPAQSFATGGFPKEDGLFFANHNELIGQFSNGQTAVANNQQITEGIYQAVLSAMRDSGGSGVVINLDGYEIAKAVSKRQDNFGKKALFGGNVNYGK